MPPRFDQNVPAPASEPYYAPSAPMQDLISQIAHAPALDRRLWCGVTMAINMDVLRPTADAEELVLDVVGSALAGDYATDQDFHLTHDAHGHVVDVDFDLA